MQKLETPDSTKSYRLASNKSKSKYSNPFTAEWSDYKSRAYPVGMAYEQEKQVRQAFHAGAVSYMEVVAQFSNENKTDKQEIDFMDSLHNEVCTVGFTQQERVVGGAHRFSGN